MKKIIISLLLTTLYSNFANAKVHGDYVCTEQDEWDIYVCTSFGLNVFALSSCVRAFCVKAPSGGSCEEPATPVCGG